MPETEQRATSAEGTDQLKDSLQYSSLVKKIREKEGLWNEANVKAGKQEESLALKERKGEKNNGFIGGFYLFGH